MMVFAASILACVISVPAPTEENPNAAKLGQFNLPLSADMEIEFRGSIPLSTYRFEGEPENQREFVILMQQGGEELSQVLRLTSKGPVYSTFAPLDLRLGTIRQLEGGVHSFTQTTRGSCRITSAPESQQEIAQ